MLGGIITGALLAACAGPTDNTAGKERGAAAPVTEHAHGLGVDPDISTDRGVTWQQVGTVPGGRPQALTGLDGGRVLAATAGGVYDSRNGGRTFAALS